MELREPANGLLPAPELGGAKLGDASVPATVFAVVCQMAGMGILQLPYTLRQSGWLMLPVLLVCAWGASYTARILIGCLYDDMGKTRLRGSYVEIGRAAFGRPGGWLVHLFEKATLFGVSALFLILAGKFLLEILEASPLSLPLSMRGWILICAFVEAFPVVLLPTISELRVVSVVGVLSTIVVMLAVLVLSVLDHERDPRHPRPGRAEGPTAFVLPSGFPVAFSGLTLSLSAHAGLPSVESAMAEPARFGRAVQFAYLIVLLLYIPVAAVGYWAYGDQVFSPILCSLPRSGSVQVLAKALAAAHVLMTYPILMNLFVTDLERGLGLEDPGAPFARGAYLRKRFVLRALSVGSNCAVAATVPFFADFMSFTGAVCIVMTTFVMPALFHLRLRWRSLTLGQKLLPPLVMICGAAGGTLGAIQSASALFDQLLHGADPMKG